jgi:hypothetical protein
MKQSCNKKQKKQNKYFFKGKNLEKKKKEQENTITIRNFFKTLKNRK